MDGDPHGLWILGISVAALLIGPAIHALARRAPPTMAALDNFVLVAVVGLVALEILPSALHLAGLAAFAVLALGALGPVLADGPLHRASRSTHGAALALAIVGMAIHSFTDGLALASAHAAGNRSHALEVAVIAHQLPVAVAVWWLLAPIKLFGPSLPRWLGPSVAMVGLGVATIAGFLLADASLDALTPSWLGLLQALFAGFLLHVIAHRADTPAQITRSTRLAASLGGLIGLALLALLALDGHGHGPAHDSPRPSSSRAAHDHDHPPTGEPDRSDPHAHATDPPHASPTLPESSTEPEDAVVAALVHLARTAAPPLILALGLALVIGRPVRQSLLRRASVSTPWHDPSAPLRTRRGPGRPRHIGLAEQHDRAAPVFAVGMLLTATLQPWLGHSPLPTIAPTLQVLLLAVLGVPAHVFAPAATPLVALLVAAGLGPGAALVFILSGPATELGALGRHHPTRARAMMAVAFLFTVALGLAIDLYLPTHRLPRAASDLALATLAALLLASFIRQTPQQFLRRLWPASHDHGHGHDHGHAHAGQPNHDPHHHDHPPH